MFPKIEKTGLISNQQNVKDMPKFHKRSNYKKRRLCPLKNFLNLSVNGLMVTCYQVPDPSEMKMRNSLKISNFNFMDVQNWNVTYYY
jgi:hypothetical protein